MSPSSLLLSSKTFMLGLCACPHIGLPEWDELWGSDKLQELGAGRTGGSSAPSKSSGWKDWTWLKHPVLLWKWWLHSAARHGRVGWGLPSVCVFWIWRLLFGGIMKRPEIVGKRMRFFTSRTLVAYNGYRVWFWTYMSLRLNSPMSHATEWCQEVHKPHGSWSIWCCSLQDEGYLCPGMRHQHWRWQTLYNQEWCGWAHGKIAISEMLKVDGGKKMTRTWWAHASLTAPSCADIFIVPEEIMQVSLFLYK